MAVVQLDIFDEGWLVGTLANGRLPSPSEAKELETAVAAGLSRVAPAGQKRALHFAPQHLCSSSATHLKHSCDVTTHMVMSTIFKSLSLPLSLHTSTHFFI